MSASDFKEINHRDAWSTIRGFVYQVDHTILRWIRLKENEALELERGEDIDYLSGEIEQGNVRTLEQLKHREAKISLNQQLTLAVLRNFYNHRENNPGLKLKFRFVTNSDYTLERPAIFIDARKGIEVWTKLNSQDQIDVSDEDLQAIKKHLLKKIAECINSDPQAPIDVQADAKLWESFRQHLETDTNLISFIHDFEWSIQNAGSDSIAADIVKELEKQYSGKPENVLYQRLFLYTFKLLCSPGIKRLDIITLKAQVALPELSVTEKQLFDNVQIILGDIVKRIDKLEADNTYGWTQIDNLYRSVDSLKSNAAFDLRLQNISYNPPNLIDKGTLRTFKVKETMSLFDRFAWVAFQGINGTGKTQLAALVCQQFRHCYWLELREMAFDAFRAPVVIESFLTGLTGEEVSGDRPIWLKRVLAKFPENSILVLNDIPEITNNDTALMMLLSIFSTILSGSNVKLLTTSNHPLSVVLKASTHLIQEYDDFTFSDEEIKECLINNGSNDRMILKFTKLIAAGSLRNPRLALAMIYHLKQMNWDEGKRGLDALAFSSEFSADVLADAQRSISRYISNEQTKELLYRLSLIRWDFTTAEVKAISEVAEKVRHPREHLSALTNIWIQHLNDKLYQVSPVISNIGENNLSDDVIKEVYTAYANALVNHSRINQRSAIRAILSYVKAGKYDDAGRLLFNFYRTASKIEEAQILEKWGYLDYWNDAPLPEEMDISLRVFIKTEQLRLTKLLNGDTAPFFVSIHEYLERATFPETEAMILKVLLLSQYPEMELSYYWKYLRYVIEGWPSFAVMHKFEVDMPVLSGLLWLPVTSIITIKDIETWLELIQLFKTNLGEDKFKHMMSAPAVGLICSRIATINSDKLAAKAFAKSKLKKLQLVHDYFQGQEILETLVIREIINVRLVLTNNIDQMKSEVLSAMAGLKQAGSLFLLNAYLGRILIRNGRPKEAKDWLENALQYDTDDQSDYIETLINAASIAAEEDIKKSIEYCQNAVTCAITRTPFLAIEHMQTLAELGVAYWLDNDPQKAFETYSDLVTALYENKNLDFTSEWIRIFALTGHATGYMSSMISTGIPPDKDGGPYFTPYIGMFTHDRRDLREQYNPKNDSMIAAQMAFFADGINYPEKAYEWSLKAFDLARSSNHQPAVLLISSTCSRYAVVQFKPEEAFEASLLFAAVSAHLSGDVLTKYNSLSSLNLKELLKVRPSEHWATAEKTTLELAVIPLLIKVLTAYLQNAEHREEWRTSYLSMISAYLPDASDQLLWSLTLEISTKIINRQTTATQLIQRSNTFGEQGKKSLQILCMVGTAFITEKPADLGEILLNFIPYLQKLNGKIGTINKFVLLPFVRLLSNNIVMKEFIGSREELQDRLDAIAQENITDSHAIQKTLQHAIELLDIKIPDDRKRWLYQYEDI